MSITRQRTWRTPRAQLTMMGRTASGLPSSAYPLSRSVYVQGGGLSLWMLLDPRPTGRERPTPYTLRFQPVVSISTWHGYLYGTGIHAMA